MSHLAAGTIVTKNYLSYARVLASSFLQYHPDVPFFTLLVDEEDGHFAPSTEPFHLVRVADLEIPNLTSFLFKNSQQQVAIAAKPYFLSHLLGQGFGGAMFLDPDILVLNDLFALWEKISQHAIVLTPHFLAPLEREGRAERELTVLRSGVYNAGCVGVSEGTAAQQFLDWWQDRLYDHCQHNVAQGMMFDQRWLDLSPAFFDDVYILRDSSYNVAYWNLPERNVRIDEDRIIVNHQPCRFFHFSGFEPDRPHAVTKYAPRLSMNNVGPAAALFRRYLALLEAAGYHESKTWPYAFGHFDNGVAIPDIPRQMYQRLGEGAQEFGNPFETGRSGSYYEWLNEPADGECDGSGKITRLWRAVYEGRGDVQRVYPDVRGADREGFLAWAVRHGANEHRIPEQFLPLAVT